VLRLHPHVLRFDRGPVAANPHLRERRTGKQWTRTHDGDRRLQLVGEYDLADKDTLAALFGALAPDGAVVIGHDEGHVH